MPDTCCGTLVTHDVLDCSCECTDAGCVDCEAPHHALVIPCTEVDGACPECSSHDQVKRPVAA